MTHAASPTLHHHRELTFPVKLLSYAVWIGAGTLFWHLGGFGAIADRQAPLSLFGGASVVSVLLTLGLALFTAAAATAVLDRWVPEAGTFAAAIGLATLSVRGGTVEDLLVRAADGAGRRSPGLPLSFALELLVWVGVLMAAIAATGWVGKRLAARGGSPGPERPRFAAEDCAVLRRVISRDSAAPATPMREGLRHAGMVAVLALTVVVVFSLDMKDRPVTHGQVLFVNAAAGWIAVYFAFRRFPVRSPMWSIAGVLAVSLVGYLIAAMTSGKFDLPANIPHSPFLRALPIQAVSAGPAGAIWAFWVVCGPAHGHPHDAPPDPPRDPRGKKRS